MVDSEFDYVRLGDGFVQCSSIMPQKRNPVALEHARAIGSKASVRRRPSYSVHNTPFGDIVDTEDDLQPLVFSMFRDATRTVKTGSGRHAHRRVRCGAAGAGAGDGWTTLTELADTLVREHGSAVQNRARDLHRVWWRRGAAAPSSPLSALLAEATSGVWNRHSSTPMRDLETF